VGEGNWEPYPLLVRSTAKERAAAMAMAGAPRTVMSLIATQQLLGPSISMKIDSLGNPRCSKSCREPLLYLIASNIFENL